MFCILFCGQLNSVHITSQTGPGSAASISESTCYDQEECSRSWKIWNGCNLLHWTSAWPLFPSWITKMFLLAVRTTGALESLALIYYDRSSSATASSKSVGLRAKVQGSIEHIVCCWLYAVRIISKSLWILDSFMSPKKYVLTKTLQKREPYRVTVFRTCETHLCPTTNVR